LATLTDWLKGWRTIADGLGEPGRAPITMAHGGRTYEVLIVSTYEPGMEEGYVVAKTASRDFDGKVALYSRRTRDTGLMRIITNKGTPRFVLRPGADAIEWASAVEGIPASRLISASRLGAVSRGIARRARQEKWDTERMDDAWISLEAQIIELEEEIEELRNESRALKRERDRLGSKK
jgi:hypothetical protein